MRIKIKKELEFDLTELAKEVESDEMLQNIVQKLSKKINLTEEEVYYLRMVLNELLNQCQIELVDTDVEELKWILLLSMD